MLLRISSVYIALLLWEAEFKRQRRDEHKVSTRTGNIASDIIVWFLCRTRGSGERAQDNNLHT